MFAGNFAWENNWLCSEICWLVLFQFRLDQSTPSSRWLDEGYKGKVTMRSVGRGNPMCRSGAGCYEFLFLHHTCESPTCVTFEYTCLLRFTTNDHDAVHTKRGGCFLHWNIISLEQGIRHTFLDLTNVWTGSSSRCIRLQPILHAAVLTCQQIHSFKSEVAVIFRI